MEPVEICTATFRGDVETASSLWIPEEGDPYWDGMVADMAAEYGGAFILLRFLGHPPIGEFGEYTLAFALERREGWSVEWKNPLPGYDTENREVRV